MSQVELRKKREEAVKRMSLLGLNDILINKFRDENAKFISKYDFPGCIRANETELEYIQKFEKDYNALVYFVNYLPTNFGEMYTMFYVSDYEEEWEMTYDMLKNNSDYAYVLNTTYEECSEIGYVEFEIRHGAMFRTA